MKKILILSLCLIVSIGTEAQKDSLSRWPAFTFKTTVSTNMYFGLKKTNYHNNGILRTPPSVGPEISFVPGIRINEYGSVFAGVSWGIVPFYMRYIIGGSLSYAPDFELEGGDYFLALTIIGIPVSYEHTFYLSPKNHITAEAGLSINYNATHSYGYSGMASIGDYPPYFYIEIQDNNGLKWYPSGFFRIGYTRAFTRNSAFNAAFRFNYSAVSLGKGYYKFDGFEGNDFFNGNLDVPINSLSFDFTYRFSHSRYRKRNL